MKTTVLAFAALLTIGSLSHAAPATPAKHIAKAKAVVASKPLPESPAEAELAAMTAVLKASTGITYNSTITSFGRTMPNEPTAAQYTVTIEKPGKMLMLINPGQPDAQQLYVDGTNVTVFDAATSKYSTAPGAASLPASMMGMYQASVGLYGKIGPSSSSLFGAVQFPKAYSMNIFDYSKLSLPVKLVDSCVGSTLDGKPVKVVAQNFTSAKFGFSMTYTIDAATNLPVEFALSSKTAAGKQVGGITEKYSNVQLLTSPVADSTFAFTAPAGATSVPPAPAPSGAGSQSSSKTLAAGAAAPDFSVNTVDGKPVKLSDYAGKVVVVDFWATWCGPCQASLPHTDAIAKLYMPKGVVFLPICTWDDQSAFAAWQKAHSKMAMTFLYDPAGQNGDSSVASKLYGVDGIPTQYVIGKDGKVVTNFVGYDEEGDPSETLLTKAIIKSLAAE